MRHWEKWYLNRNQSPAKNNYKITEDPYWLIQSILYYYDRLQSHLKVRYIYGQKERAALLERPIASHSVPYSHMAYDCSNTVQAICSIIGVDVHWARISNTINIIALLLNGYLSWVCLGFSPSFGGLPTTSCWKKPRHLSNHLSLKLTGLSFQWLQHGRGVERAKTVPWVLLKIGTLNPLVNHPK